MTITEFVIWLAVALPAILLVAFVANRLLGVRRSWPAVLLSGGIGYVLGTMAALAGADFDHNDPGLVRDILAFSVVATMLAAITIDLLRRPEQLAQPRGRRGIPHPVRRLRDELRPVPRYREIVDIARRNGFGPTLGLGRRRAADDDVPIGVRLRLTLEECGGMFVKLGQLASTRTDLLPPEITGELAKLQSGAPPAPAEDVRALLEEELGDPVGDVFPEFEWEPIAAASIAQAHAATLHTGEAVVVKVQRPDVRALVERDTDVLIQLAHLVQTRTAWGADYDIFGLVQEFTQALADELDFSIEARHALAIAENLATDPVSADTIRVPRVFSEHSTSRVLVQERLPGVPLSVDPGLADRIEDREGLATGLLQSFLHQMLVDGLFHADPHPGNVFVLDGDRIGLIDFGAAGVLDSITRDALQQMVLAATLRDAHLLRQAVSQVTVISPDTDTDALERALAHFMAVHIQPGAGISPSALNDLTPLFREFGIELPVGLTSFGRTFVILEGTLRVIAPGFSIADSIQRLALEWKEQMTEDGDLEEVARNELLAAMPTLRLLPRKVDDLTTQLTRGQLSTRVRLFANPDDARFVQRMANRAVLAFVGAVALVVSTALVITDAGPEFVGEATMLNFFGYLGLLGGAVLELRVVASVIRDGLT